MENQYKRSIFLWMTFYGFDAWTCTFYLFLTLHFFVTEYFCSFLSIFCHTIETTDRVEYRKQPRECAKMNNNNKWTEWRKNQVKKWMYQIEYQTHMHHICVRLSNHNKETADFLSLFLSSTTVHLNEISLFEEPDFGHIVNIRSTHSWPLSISIRLWLNERPNAFPSNSMNPNVIIGCYKVMYSTSKFIPISRIESC